MTCRPLGLLETLDEYAVVLCGPCARDAHAVVSDVEHTDVPDVPDEALASDLDVVVRAAIDAGWTPERRDGPSVAMSRDQVGGWDVVLADFDTGKGLRGAIHDRNVPGEPRTFDHTESLAQVLSWLTGTAAAQAGADGPSCHGCGTTVLAAVTVHPTEGAYLVEDQARDLRQWLTAWCDTCAENELGDEPGWLVSEDADTATWPALAADTITGRLWDAVGVCFARHDHAGRDGGEGEGGEGDRWRGRAAMVRWLSCGLRFPVSRRERRLWAGAGSLGDLGELTAGWLTGQIGWQPGYHGPVDVDEDQAPGLTAALVALCRAGMVTRNSQAGLIESTTHGRARWVQHAAVTGYADTQAWYRLVQAMDGTGYQMLAHVVRRRWHRGRPGVVVTWRDGQPYTEFGAQLATRQVRADLDGAGRPAVMAAACALQVTIWDPTVGANTLWEHLTGLDTAEEA